MSSSEAFRGALRHLTASWPRAVLLGFGLLGTGVGLLAEKLLGAPEVAEPGAMTRKRLAEAARYLEAATEKADVTPVTFVDASKLLRRTLGEEVGAAVSVDAWDAPLVLIPLPGGFAMISCGADGDCNTADDLITFGGWPGETFAPPAKLAEWTRERPAGSARRRPGDSIVDWQSGVRGLRYAGPGALGIGLLWLGWPLVKRRRKDDGAPDATASDPPAPERKEPKK
jgi:hypothetical protein